MSKRMSLEDRLWRKVDKTGDCWVWTGPAAISRGNFRYGQISKGGRYDRKNHYVHILSYRIHNGANSIPDGYQIDHLCKNTLCVRPEHLEAVTASENARRSDSPAGINSRKTHCPQGHEYTPDNTNWYGRKRTCLTCARERMRVVRARKKAS